MIRRAIGLILVLLGLTGLAFCYMGARAARDFVDNVGQRADEVLETTAISVATVEESLEQSRQTVGSITETIGQVKTTTANLALTVDDTQPTLDQLALLVGEDIPGTIDSVQNTIPNIAQTAKVVDDTLRLLSKLRVEETVPLINYEISFGLGVEYNPEIPFDQAVEEVGAGLEPIATSSGNLEGELQTAKANMVVLSRDLNDLADSLDTLNDEAGKFRPLLDEYSSLVESALASISDARTQLPDQLSAAKRAIILAAIWLGLFQLLPLYFGLELLMGNRMVRSSGTWPHPASPVIAQDDTTHDSPALAPDASGRAQYEESDGKSDIPEPS